MPMLASAGVTGVSVGREILLGAVDSREASAPALSVSATVEGTMDGAPPPNWTATGVRLPSSGPTAVSLAVFTLGPVESLCKPGIRESLLGFEVLSVCDGGFLKGAVGIVLPETRFKEFKALPNLLSAWLEIPLLDPKAAGCSTRELPIEEDGFSVGLFPEISEGPRRSLMLESAVLSTITAGRSNILEAVDGWEPFATFFSAAARVEGGFGSALPFNSTAA